MIANGQRPVAAELRDDLVQLDVLTDQFLAAVQTHDTASGLLNTLLAPALASKATASTKAGSLLQLGDAYLLPLAQGDIQYPADILMTTNGVLGNHLEVRYSAGAFGFIGRGRHALKNMVDNNPTSWTEVEAYQLNADGIHRTRGFGFTADEGIQWLLPPGEPLRWQLTLQLPRADYGYLYLSAPAHIPQMRAERILSGTDLLAANVPLSASVMIPLTGQTEKMTIELSQPHAYLTTIGHSYQYEALTPTGEVLNESDARRIPGPYPVLRPVGAQVAADQRVSWAPMTLQTDAQFERPDAPLEVMTAWRYALALSEVALISGTFMGAGEVILGPYTWTDMPARVRLDATVSVPTDWVGEDWVQLAISANQSDWYPISSDGIAAPREYALGTIPVQEELSVIPTSVAKFWLRLRLQGKSTDLSHTPIVSNLQLVGES